MGKLGFGALALVAMALLGAQGANAAGSPWGSYMQTCMNVEMNGNDLSATCERRDNSMNDAILPMATKCTEGVDNQNGVLRCHGHVPNGSYNATCTGQRTEGEYRLTATCRTRAGDWNASTLNDPWACNGYIENQDGELVCPTGD